MKKFEYVEDETPRPDIPFELEYMEKTVEEIDGEKKTAWIRKTDQFTCTGDINGGVVMQTVGAFAAGGASMSLAIRRFFDVALIEEDVVRFRAIISSANTRVQMQQLADMTDWLISEYTEASEARPTKRA